MIPIRVPVPRNPLGFCAYCHVCFALAERGIQTAVDRSRNSKLVHGRCLKPYQAAEAAREAEEKQLAEAMRLQSWPDRPGGGGLQRSQGPISRPR